MLSFEEIKGGGKLSTFLQPLGGDCEEPLKSTARMASSEVPHVPVDDTPQPVSTRHKERARESKTAVEVGGKPMAEYTNLKESTNARAYAETLLGTGTYKTELAGVLQPRTAYTMQTYQYRIETFTPELRNKTAKDLGRYSGTEAALQG